MILQVLNLPRYCRDSKIHCIIVDWPCSSYKLQYLIELVFHFLKCRLTFKFHVFLSRKIEHSHKENSWIEICISWLFIFLLVYLRRIFYPLSQDPNPPHDPWLMHTLGIKFQVNLANLVTKKFQNTNFAWIRSLPCVHLS